MHFVGNVHCTSDEERCYKYYQNKNENAPDIPNKALFLIPLQKKLLGADLTYIIWFGLELK